MISSRLSYGLDLSLLSDLQELQRFRIYPFLLYLCTVESQQHYMVTVAEWLRRKFVELVYMGSSPICHTNPAG